MTGMVALQVLSVIALSSFLICSTVSAEPFVTVQSCKADLTYIGFITESGVESFLNIPFGQDTSGPNRFKHPKPWVPPTDAGPAFINATVIGPACPQAKVPIPTFPLLSNVTSISEDCLNLRITRPVGTGPKDNLPVMIYIYGGGNVLGQIYDTIYTPDDLVLHSQKLGKSIIYVAMNYRVNFFGFAASIELASEGSLNSALLDQKLALDWVQGNIGDFGGDPNKVTIFGESAGAQSVSYQIMAYGGLHTPPFQQAIMQSGNPVSATATAVPIEKLEAKFNGIARAVNCTPNSYTKAEVLECVRRVPTDILAEVVIAYYLEKDPPFGFGAFSPIVDGHFIPLPPSELLSLGAFYRNVPTIHGWNEDDASLFTPTSLNSTANITEWLKTSRLPGLTNETIAALLSLYPESDFPYPLKRASRIDRDLGYTCGSIYLSRQQKLYGESNTHLYLLNQTALDNYIPFEVFGVSHFADIIYVFDTVSEYSQSSSKKQLAAQMSGAWIEFATTGNAGRWWPRTFASAKDAEAWAGEMVVLGGGEPAAFSITEKENLVERCEFILSLAGQLHT